MFNKLILTWFKDHRRDLPWRNTRDPYRIWISEIILQQTRVAQGYEYFVRFIQRFPDVYALAQASEDEVMKQWQGLGYYSRARNLHAAAKQIVELGSFPTDYEGIRALKGVGDYTAAAISSFAFNLPYAVVDGNVYRVLSRYMGIDTPIDSTAGKKLFAQLAQELLDTKHPDDYNQAIMDFGALQCVPKNPDCSICPLAETCIAFRDQKVAELPIKQHKTKVSHRFFHYIYVRKGTKTYIQKRTEDDIWRNLYEIPLLESDHAYTMQELVVELEGMHWLDGQSAAIRLVSRGVKHVLSHQIILADLYELIINEDRADFPGFLCIEEEDLNDYAVPRLISQLLEKLK